MEIVKQKHAKNLSSLDLTSDTIVRQVDYENHVNMICDYTNNNHQNIAAYRKNSIKILFDDFGMFARTPIRVQK